MTEETILEKAKKIASENYQIQVYLDETTDGGNIYVALNPELYGCLAQGETREEAIQNLYDFRVDYIAHLIENKLPIPKPIRCIASTINLTPVSNTIVTIEYPIKSPQMVNAQESYVLKSIS